MTTTHEEDEIIDWLRENTMPLEHIHPCDDTEDLVPLKKILEGVKVIGLGEATHGTKEFFHIRHRILRFLVTDMGFNALAIEGSYSAAQPINDYILNGEGDRSSLLTGLGYAIWDVQEFLEVLDWLHAYNQSSVRDADKVRFYGLDICNTRVGREKILNYLRTVAPDRVASVDEMFQRIALAETRGWSLAHEQINEDLLLQMQGLLDFFGSKRDVFVSRTTIEEYEQTIRHIRVILQWLRVSIPDELPPLLPRKTGLNNFARSMFMAENLVHFMERDNPDAKVIIWAHNFHIGVGFEDPVLGMVPTMGHYLRERFGREYYAFGLELNHGPYLARAWSPENKALGDFVVGNAPSAPEGSFPWYLSRTGKHNLMLSLRETLHTPQLEQWLTASKVMHVIPWAYFDPPVLYTEMAPKKHYDGIVFVENTSATTPTTNALGAVLQRSTN